MQRLYELHTNVNVTGSYFSTGNCTGPSTPLPVNMTSNGPCIAVQRERAVIAAVVNTSYYAALPALEASCSLGFYGHFLLSGECRPTSSSTSFMVNVTVYVPQ